MSRYKYFENIVIDKTGQTRKGFMNDNLKNIVRFDDDILWTIPLKFQYRPDLISYYFYGNVEYAWIIIYNNRIDNSPEGFYKGRKIYVPKYERVVNLA